MHPPVTFNRRERMPFVTGRHSETVGPVGVMRHNAAASRPAYQRTQQCGAFHACMPLKITKRCRRFCPAIEPEHGRLQTRPGFQHRLVQRHVKRRLAFAGIDKKPGTHFDSFSLTPILGHSLRTSQFAQSGLRAKHRRRPCQISKWLNSVHSFCGTSFIKSVSIFSGAL